MVCEYPALDRKSNILVMTEMNLIISLDETWQVLCESRTFLSLITRLDKCTLLIYLYLQNLLALFLFLYLFENLYVLGK